MGSEKKAATRSGDFEVRLPTWWRYDWQAALPQVACEANRCISRELVDVLGTLSVAPRRFPEEAFSGLCIRSEPLPDFGGAEFRHYTGPSAAGVPPTELLIDLAPAALRFRAAGDQIAVDATEARALTSEVISLFCESQPPARLVAIGVSADVELGDCSTTIEVELLGDDLVMGIHAIRVASSRLTLLRKKLEALLTSHARRSVVLANHRAGGSRGLIDQTASRLMTASGMDPAFALDLLDRRSGLDFRFGDGNLLGRLHWKDGVLTADVFKSDNEFYIWEGTFTCRRRYPETLRTALIGRTLSSLVDRPYVPVDAIITDVVNFGPGATRINLEVPTELLPEVGTRPRPETA